MLYCLPVVLLLNLLHVTISWQHLHRLLFHLVFMALIFLGRLVANYWWVRDGLLSVVCVQLEPRKLSVIRSTLVSAIQWLLK